MVARTRPSAPASALAWPHVIVALVCLVASPRGGAAAGATDIRDEGGVALWFGERAIHGSGLAGEHAGAFGFIGDVRPARWPVAVDLGLLFVMHRDFTKLPSGVFVPPVTGTNLDEVHAGIGRRFAFGRPLGAYVAGGLALVHGEFADEVPDRDASLTYAGGYARAALSAHWRWLEAGVDASWVGTPPQRLETQSRRATGAAVGVFAGVSGSSPPETPAHEVRSRWGIELRGAPDALNSGSTRDDFTASAPVDTRSVAYRGRPAFEGRVTLSSDPDAEFGSVVGLGYTHHRMDFGEAFSDVKLGEATMHAVHLSADFVHTPDDRNGRRHAYHWGAGVLLGVAWPTAVAMADGDPSLAIVRTETRAQVLAGVETSAALRVPGAPLWLGIWYERALGFGPPPIEMVTDPSSGYRSGFAGYSPAMFGFSLGWQGTGRPVRAAS